MNSSTLDAWITDSGKLFHIFKVDGKYVRVEVEFLYTATWQNTVNGLLLYRWLWVLYIVWVKLLPYFAVFYPAYVVALATLQCSSRDGHPNLCSNAATLLIWLYVGISDKPCYSSLNWLYICNYIKQIFFYVAIW